jgi:hypothetical protein
MAHITFGRAVDLSDDLRLWFGDVQVELNDVADHHLLGCLADEILFDEEHAECASTARIN